MDSLSRTRPAFASALTLLFLVPCSSVCDSSFVCLPLQHNTSSRIVCIMPQKPQVLSYLTGSSNQFNLNTLRDAQRNFLLTSLCGFTKRRHYLEYVGGRIKSAIQGNFIMNILLVLFFKYTSNYTSTRVCLFPTCPVVIKLQAKMYYKLLSGTEKENDVKSKVVIPCKKKKGSDLVNRIIIGIYMF